MLDAGSSTSGARVWKPWVPAATDGSASRTPPSLEFEPTEQAQTSTDASSPRLPDADHGTSAAAASQVLPDMDHGMSAYTASHRLPVAGDGVSLAAADDPTSSLVGPASRSPVMVSGVSSVPDLEALYALPGLMASGSDSQPALAAQPASVAVRHAPAGAAAVSDAAVEAPPAAQAPAVQGAVPADETATGSGDAEVAAGQSADPAGARSNPAPVDGGAAAGHTAAPAGGSLQPAPFASAAAVRGESGSGPPSTSQAPMDARQMQLPAKFASEDAAGELLHAPSECTWVSALCRGPHMSIRSPRLKT